MTTSGCASKELDAAQNGTKKLTSYDKITNERRVYILPLVNYNVYWPLIGQLYSMTSFFCTILRSIKKYYFFSLK